MFETGDLVYVDISLGLSEAILKKGIIEGKTIDIETGETVYHVKMSPILKITVSEKFLLPMQPFI